MARSRSLDPPLSGILNINKPAGWTSFDVVSLVRRKSGVRRVGHGGTLDPAATGVLPVAVGPAARFLEYLLLVPKVYDATVQLGVTTDTYDAEGRVMETHDARAIGIAEIERVLPDFIGEIQQVPPLFSALKREGMPLYKLARAGEHVEREPRTVKVYGIRVLEFHSPRLRLSIECGRGTYIRSLAHDLGEVLGCGAHVESLTRTQVGAFHLRSSLELANLPEAGEFGEWNEVLHPADSTLEQAPAALIHRQHAADLRDGRSISLDLLEKPELARAREVCRAYDAEGNFIAVLRYDEDWSLWRPSKVVQHTE